MRVLLDEGVPYPLTRHLSHHQVETVVGRGWASVKNGNLLQLIEAERFQVFVTGDKNIPAQQNLLGRPFAILILSAINWPVIRENLPAIIKAVDDALPGTVIPVAGGVFRPRRHPAKPRHWS